MSTSGPRSSWKWVLGGIIAGGIGFISWLYSYRLGRSSAPEAVVAVPPLETREAPKADPARQSQAGWAAGARRKVFPAPQSQPRPLITRPQPRRAAPQSKLAPARPEAPSVIFRPVWEGTLPNPIDSPPSSSAEAPPPGDSSEKDSGAGQRQPVAGQVPADRPSVAVTGMVRTPQGLRILVEDLQSGRGAMVAPGEEAFGYRVSHFDERKGTAVLERGPEVRQVHLGENKIRKAPSAEEAEPPGREGSEEKKESSE